MRASLTRSGPLTHPESQKASTGASLTCSEPLTHSEFWNTSTRASFTHSESRKASTKATTTSLRLRITRSSMKSAGEAAAAAAAGMGAAGDDDCPMRAAAESLAAPRCWQAWAAGPEYTTCAARCKI